MEVELGKSKTKAYFLVNYLPEASEILDWYIIYEYIYIYISDHLCRISLDYFAGKLISPRMGLLFFILAHIMMNQNHLTESKCKASIEIVAF